MIGISYKMKKLELKIKVNTARGIKYTEKDIDETIDILEPLVRFAEEDLKFKFKGMKTYPDGTKIILVK